MQTFIYGLAYYLAIFLVALTLSLLVFIVPSARKLLHRFRLRFSNIFQNQFIRYGVILIFIIILLILADSLLAYRTLNTHFKRKSKYDPDNVGMGDLDVMSARSRQSYLLQLKQYREYYLAQRNILLSFAVLFIFFAFQRILHSIVKYSETEHRLEVIFSANAQNQSSKKHD